MPYGGPPKSGCRSRPDVAPVELSHAFDHGFTGRLDMSVFQMLFAGNTGHVVPGGAAAFAWCTGTSTSVVMNAANAARAMVFTPCQVAVKDIRLSLSYELAGVGP